MYKRKRRYNRQETDEINSVAKGKSVEATGPPLAGEPHIPVSGDIGVVRQAVLDILGSPPDLAFREFSFGTTRPVRCLVAHIDGLTDPVSVADNLIRPLVELPQLAPDAVDITPTNAADMVKERLTSVWQLRTDNDLGRAVTAMLDGQVLLFIEGSSEAIIAGRRQIPGRQVDNPDIQQVIRGPREAFTERIRDNTGLIRKRLSHESLRIEQLRIGRLTNTVVCLVWIEGIVSPKVLEEARKRLKRIDIDAIIDSGYIEELIEDQPWSPFPTVYNTERPDSFCASLLEGRVGILTDGSPEGLIVPASFVMFFQSAEDYYQRFHITLLIRLIRLIAAFLSLLLPSIYIAATTFHHEMIPTALLLSIAAGRETVPFPAVIEALFMVFAFEILREAGIRLPGIVGQAVSIVGALVIGQAVVSAGVVSSFMVIVIALTEIASFALPFYDMGATLRILRYPIIVLAASLGVFGIIISLLAMLIHLCSLRSFGSPYLTGISPFIPRDVHDIFVRVPWPMMRWRPRLAGQRHPERQATGSGPRRPKGRGRENETTD
ncbi:MAG: spore germination protein [Chloroflexota bacterium]